MDNGDRPRYTRHYVDQPARNLTEMERPYYVAGGKIDGSVIQHYPGSEILVVDFEKDEHLRRFYDSTILKYQELSAGEKLKVSLPAFLQTAVQGSVIYNENIVNAISRGKLKWWINNPSRMDSLNPMISRSGLKDIMNAGALSDKKVAVGTYLRIGVGVCRQQGVILAACMERAISEGKAPGWKGVEIRANQDIILGHVWAVLKDDKDNEVVFDPALKYNGSAKRGGWNYRLGYEKHVFGVPD